MVRQSPTSSLARLRWSGRDVFYRSGTADPFVLYQVLLRGGQKAEYYVPPASDRKSFSTSAATSVLPLFIFTKNSPTPRFSGLSLIPIRFGYCTKMSRICVGSRFSTTASERLINALRSALIR